MTVAGSRSSLLDARAIKRALDHMAKDIIDLAGDTNRLVLVGIQRRGVELAERLAGLISEKTGNNVERGALDITLYRDDLETVGPRPLVGRTHLPGDLSAKCVVIVDDVLYTGRTIRAALDELADFGRPRRIALAVLIDRGGRELPIAPDVVGKTLSTTAEQRVDVLVEEVDGRDAVILAPRETAGSA